MVVSTDDNGYSSGNVSVCDTDVRNADETEKVADFSGIWWSQKMFHNCVTPQPDATDYH